MVPSTSPRVPFGPSGVQNPWIPSKRATIALLNHGKRYYSSDQSPVVSFKHYYDGVGRGTVIQIKNNYLLYPQTWGYF